MAKEGSASEIGQISFGIVADPKPAIAAIAEVKAAADAAAATLGKAGSEAGTKFTQGVATGAGAAAAELRTVQVEAAKTSNAIAQEGRVAGTKYSGGFLDGLMSGSKGVKGAVKGIHNLLGIASAAYIVKEAYDLGQSIRNAVVEGMKSGQQTAGDFLNTLQGGGTEEDMIARAKALQQKIAENAGAIAGARESIFNYEGTARRLEEETKALDFQLSIQQKSINKVNEERQALADRNAEMKAYVESYQQAAEAVERFRTIEREAAEERKQEQEAYVAGYDMMGQAVRDFKEQDSYDRDEAMKQGQELADFMHQLADAVVDLKKSVDNAVESMRNQQDSFVNSVLGSMSVDLRELRTVTTLRAPRR